MAGKASRAKGHGFERFVAKDIRCILGDPNDDALRKVIKRGLQSRNNEDKVEDVIAPAFSIECKAYKSNPPIKKAIRQAKETAILYNKIPVAIIKQNNIPPFVVLDYEDFIGILSCLINTTLGDNDITKVDLQKFSDEVVQKIKNGFNSVKVLRSTKDSDGPGTDDPAA